MLRINQIKMPLEHTEDDILHKAAKILRIEPEQIKDLRIVKKSIDARKKPNIAIIYSVDVSVKAQDRVFNRCHSNQVQAVQEKPYQFPTGGSRKLTNPPVIVGTGPAGLFCGYMLAKHGYRPILIERGKPVQQRREDVERFWREGVLNTSSNVQFGEGGAGTFSDGKLNTLIKDKFGRNREVLRIFVEAGAPKSILYDAKPHVGTDILVSVVSYLRQQIIDWDGQFLFETTVTDLIMEQGSVKGVVLNNGRGKLRSDMVVLAIGHSARDTFQILYDRQIPMEAKAFAVGLRMEHPRQMIDNIQYGMEEHPLLPAATYKVTAQTTGGRGVYSFCMCPGGYVVNASSEEGRLAVNGMSYSKRDGANSNSAMIVTVTPEDFQDDSQGPLAGVAFQRRLEERAYQIGKGAVPVESYGDFRQAVTDSPARESEIRKRYPDFQPAIKGTYRFAPVHDILPDVLNRALVEGIDLIGQNVKNFNDSGAYLSGVESRTSSPVRIMRDESGQSMVRGLYPCGEGAGYAGGITSAAMDGIFIAEKIAAVYAP